MVNPSFNYSSKAVVGTDIITKILVCTSLKAVSVSSHLIRNALKYHRAGHAISIGYMY